MGNAVDQLSFESLSSYSELVRIKTKNSEQFPQREKRNQCGPVLFSGMKTCMTTLCMTIACFQATQQVSHSFQDPIRTTLILRALQACTSLPQDSIFFSFFLYLHSTDLFPISPTRKSQLLISIVSSMSLLFSSTP